MSSEAPHIDLQSLRARREEILGCAAEHGAGDVRVFGSLARGDATLESDVDLLVRWEPGEDCSISLAYGRTWRICLGSELMCSVRAA